MLERFTIAISDGLAHIGIDRPEAHNAIDMLLAEETLVVAREIERASSEVRAILISGTGKSLTVGGDIEYFRTASKDGDLGDVLRKMATPFHEGLRLLGSLDVPIVTAAHGPIAGGGLGFVWCADIVVAAQSTRFIPAFPALGVTGDGGWSWHLQRRIGSARARNIMLRNLPITADQALEWGLVAEVVSDEEVIDVATSIASGFAQGPTRAYAGMRRLMSEAWSRDLATQLNAETDGLAASGRTRDMNEAVRCFLEGRTTPEFTGA